MQIEQSEINAWVQPLAGKQGDKWPTQVTLHKLLRGGELHRFEREAHILVCREQGGDQAHLVSTINFMAPLPQDEIDFIKSLLAGWAPKHVWFAWLQRDSRLTQNHPNIIKASGLSKVTKKKINGWAISVNIKTADLEKLIRG